METKICRVCKRELPVCSFWKKTDTADGFHSICKECKAEYDKEYRKKNKDKVKKHNAEYYVKNRRKCLDAIKRNRLEMSNMVSEYKTSRGCSLCGEKHPGCLVFHHRNPEDKEDSISHALSYHGWGKKKLINEMEKCDILCANCHRKLHWEERNGVWSDS